MRATSTVTSQTCSTGIPGWSMRFMSGSLNSTSFGPKLIPGGGSKRVHLSGAS